MFSNNISVTFQQTKKGESLTYDTPSLLNWHLKIFLFDIIHLLLYLLLYFQSAILHKGNIRLR